MIHAWVNNKTKANYLIPKYSCEGHIKVLRAINIGGEHGAHTTHFPYCWMAYMIPIAFSDC